jgi:hypothetical protein
MKRLFSISLLFGMCALISSLSMEAMSTSWMPSLPKMPSFNLSSLTTPQAVSNAISRIASVFKLLSPQTLASIVQTQTKKFNENISAYIENPSLARGAAATANVLAAAAAALVLAGEAAAIAGAVYVGGKKAAEKAEELMPSIPGK